jgi:hypothetical protein
VIKTRKPTGVPPWPLILIEGPSFSGKSWAAAELTRSEKVGRAYWIEWGAGSADEYAAIDGTDYEIVCHDGTWHDIADQVIEISDAETGAEKPAVLILDSMTTEWDMLKDWVSARARASKYAQKLLREDPDAEIKPSGNLWNDANDRHDQLMHLLLTFPGIVAVTAQGKESVAVDADGRPIPKSQDYRVDCHRSLTTDASVWVRLSRDEPPLVVGCRSTTLTLRPGVDDPLRYVEGIDLEALLFDTMRLDVDRARARDVVGLVTDESQLADIARAMLRDYCEQNGHDLGKVANAFHNERSEQLRDCRDPAAIWSFLRELKKQAA